MQIDAVKVLQRIEEEIEKKSRHHQAPIRSSSEIKSLCWILLKSDVSSEEVSVIADTLQELKSRYEDVSQSEVKNGRNPITKVAKHFACLSQPDPG